MSTLHQRFQALITVPADPAILETHQQTVLTRTHVAALVAAVVMPVTIFSHFGPDQRMSFALMATISLVADGAVALLLLGLHTPLLRKHYHWGFFLLVGIICSGTESLMLQLTGGGAASDFLYPYFLILFGVATLFPARFGWALAAALMIPLSYLIGELAVQGEIARGAPLNRLVLLVETTLITVAANLITTRTFFSELLHRQAVERANEQLREVDKAKSDFFANLSHDLKTPLNLVIGPIQAVSQRASNLDERSVRYLEMALRSARRLDAMINDLLELARIESGAIKLNRTRVDLGALLGNFVEATGPYAATLGQRVEFIPPAQECLAEVDPDKLERVVGNLISNALKFSPPGAVVRVRLTQTARSVQIDVQDEGPGIPAEEHQRIFQRFARGSDASRGQTRGAGVGLAVVREFAELHQGTVTLESAPGKGSTFTVVLPRSASSPEVASSEGTSPPERRQFSAPPFVRPIPKVLLVEDDDEMRVFLTAELGREVEVVAVSDGEAALRLAAEHPDLVLMDVGLPGIDGVEAVRLLRRHPATAGVPILVYSARSDLQTRLSAFRAGADDFVPKPVDPLELRARLESLLRRAGRVGGGPELGPSPPGAGE